MNFKKILAIAMLLTITMTTNLTFGVETAGDLSTKTTIYSEGYNKYTNNPYGYEIVLSNYLVLNEDIVNVKSRFESESLVVEVLYDNFNNTLDNKDSYNIYGNKGIKRNEEFKVTEEYEHPFGGVSAHITLYERRKLKFNEEDRNFYATISIPRTSKEIVTVFIKSSEPIYINYIMPSFKFITKTGIMKPDAVFEPYQKNFDILTQKFYDQYLGNNEKVDFGIFEPTFPIYEYKLNQLESLFNYNFPVTLTYNSFALPFKTAYMDKAKELGKVVEYTLYTTDMINGKEKDISLAILEGKYDDYLDNLAESFNRHDFPVLFRINNEMNGAWVWYSSYFVGKDTDLYIDCWRYIYNKFKEHGVDNVIFVWNPNELSFPNFAYNHYLSYYPGNEFVDVVGLTAYNTGNYYEGETWRKFSDAYDDFYYDYESHFKHPMMITEFSCSTTGGNKSEWFTDMFNTITKYDRIKLAVLWNGQDYDTSKPVKTVSRNYRLDLDDSVINALIAGLQNFK